MTRRLALSAIAVAFSLAACDETFTPLDSRGLQFSVFGYLDAAADTQWIRVSPIRPVLTTTPGPLAAKVTLENLRTGRKVELRDSMFLYGHNPDVGSEGVFLHNFWTAERLEPGAAYRFSASAGGEAPAKAVVEIPPDFQLEVWLGDNQSDPVGEYLHVSGLRHVAFITATSHFYDACGSAVQRTFFVFDVEDPDDRLVRINRAAGRPGCGTARVEKRELTVVGSGAPWPSGREFITSGLGVPEVASNISDAVGFLGGVLSKVVPYESCEIERTPGNREHCILRYDAGKATLRGVVTDARCGGPVVAAEVRLREVDLVPPAARKIRVAQTTRTGEFEIGALDPEKRYALTIRRLSPAFFDEFQEHTAPIQLSPGEIATHDATLVRVDPCPR